MKAYQVIENGKPLEERELEKPQPKGKSFTKNSSMWSLSL